MPVLKTVTLTSMSCKKYKLGKQVCFTANFTKEEEGRVGGWKGSGASCYYSSCNWSGHWRGGSKTRRGGSYEILNPTSETLQGNTTQTHVYTHKDSKVYCMCKHATHCTAYDALSMELMHVYGWCNEAKWERGAKSERKNRPTLKQRLSETCEQ